MPLAWFWQASLVPDTYDMAEMGHADYGGGPRTGHHHHGHGSPVADLVADPDRKPDVRHTLTVRREGKRYTVNGSTPGPELRVTLGQLVEITLVNDNVEDGTTLHWHGLDVPNAMDGVAGLTQDAVGVGEQFVYRFVADQVGTFWYHSHQVSHEQVVRGLLGALVVEPTSPDRDVLDEVAVLHRYDAPTLNGEKGVQTVDADPGARARVRVVNTDNGLTRVWVTGTPYEVLAVDGTDLRGTEPVTDKAIGVPAGGRVDLGFVVPEDGARVEFGGKTAMVFGEDPTGGEGSSSPDDDVDLLSYGEPGVLGLDVGHPDRRFDYEIDRRPGFLDGRPGMWWTINGHLFPDVPMFMVEEGDVVVFDIRNDSGDAHPMHLHGHHAVVLSRDGEKATGSPWWVDSLEVGVGESYEVAFLADNPGLWMDHCHNLQHAVEGLVAHLMYGGVRSSYRVGDDAGNEPE
jgi:FtsP/CotA-like multicopper oxidase with cupredoxin domain